MRALLLLSFASAAALALGACSVEERNFDASSTGSGGDPTGSSTSSGGGSGGDGGGGGSTGTIKDACAAYAKAICAGTGQCIPFLMTTIYGAVDACEPRYELYCNAFASAPGTSWTPGGVQACAGALAASACPDFVKGILRGTLPECKPLSGKLPTGAPCIDSGQCSGGYCDNDDPDLCGVCSTLSGQGEPCTSFVDCKPGLMCDGSACVTAGLEGDPCAIGTTYCDFPLLCYNGKCGPGAVAGAMCDPMFSACNYLDGVFCDAQTTTCKKFMFAAEGGECGYSSGESYQCTASAGCQYSAAPPHCVPPAPDGGACKVGEPPGCVPPAICFKDACTLPDPGACGP